MALIIKSLAVDPPNYDELSDDEDDYVKDPAQYRDQLPQPLRYIDELLTLFIDEVWEEITLREDEKAAERSKIRPPKYECALQLQENPTTKAMASSADGRYIFMAFPGGVSVLEAAKRKVLHTYEDERMDLTSLACTIIGPEMYLLTGIDELGMCRVLGSCMDKVFIMKVMNEEASHKYQAVRCEASADGDFLGVVSENPSSNETMFEVYQLPRDTWGKEMEDVKNKLIQAEESKVQEPVSSQHLSSTQETAEDGGAEATPREPAVHEAEEEGQVSARKSTESRAGTRGHSRSKEKTSKSSKPRGAASERSKSREKTKSGLMSRQVSVETSKRAPSRVKAREASNVSQRNSSRSSSRTSQSKPGTSSRMSSRRKKTGSKRGANYKFSPTTLVMRHHPPEGLVANSGVSAAATLISISDPKLILGSGQGHLLSRPYIEIRQEAFNNMHQDTLMYRLPEDENESKHLECNFHFFTPGLAIPYGIEQPGALKKPSSVGVWWGGSSQFIYYSLTKPVKVKKTAADAQDAASRKSRVRLAVPGQPVTTPRSEQLDGGSTSQIVTRPELDIKPETVWPQADVITASAMSSDSSLIALGLKNGIVTVWDKFLCCVRKSVVVCQSPIEKLEFMNPSICPQGNSRPQVYPTTASCYVLVRGEDSSVHLLNCAPRSYSPPIMVAEKSTDDDNVITSVALFPEKSPEIILKTYKNGNMFLQDVISTKTLCEICLPSTHELTTPWDPIISVSAYGQMLYIKGTQKTADEEYVDKTTESVFVFQLRSFPALDSYWMKTRPQINYISFSPIETRVSALLSNRVKSSGARQQRLQQRWPLMKQELTRISHIKSH